jgi:alpha-glucosidase
VSAHVLRVRFRAAPAFGREHSYAIVDRDLGATDAANASYRVDADRSEIRTDGLTVSVAHRPFRLQITAADGRVIDADDAAQGIYFNGSNVRVAKQLHDDEQIYGLGEKSGRLNRRGKQLGGYGYTMWNTDAFAYDAGIDPLYASIPFYLVLRAGRAHGVFLDNTFRSNFDIGKQSQSVLSFGAEDGDLDYYVIDGPDPKAVIARYTQLTGRMPLPPMWALGYHQCRYSYYPESRVRDIAQQFRARKIPADTLWLDIHYLDGYNPLTWDRTRFPDPAAMISDLRDEGFRLVTIIDAHPKKQPGWDVYDSGLAGDHFIKNPDGSVYEAPVWPSNAAVDPGPSVFPDFSRPATRAWWGGLHKRLTDIGVAGIWNDMNEPAVFVGPTWTMATGVRHDNEGQPTDHREIHNVYGQLMTRSTYEGLLALRPADRPFVLTRATFAGGQRYAAVWPGDNTSNWADLRMSIPMLTSLGLSGFAFVGADIGGFADSPTPELYTRWLQTGVFYPFMRTHTADGTADQEPWSYGPVYEAVNRRAIELRYELLPTIYSEMRQASVTGVPAMRPLMLDYPTDKNTWELDDQFLFGSDLLVAPVLHEAQVERDVYLPGGTWYDFATGAAFAGGARVKRPVTLASLPVFARAGAFVFMQPVVQNTGEMAGQPLRVRIFPAPASSGALYEDDGRSFAYRDGGATIRRFSQQRSARRVTVAVAAGDGAFRPAARALELHFVATAAPNAVSLSSSAGTRRLPRVAFDTLAAQAEAWSIAADGSVVVRTPDRSDAFGVSLSL